jgi:hypothetical protein
MTSQPPREQVLSALANHGPTPDGNPSADPRPQPETPPPPSPGAPAASSNGRDGQGRFAKGNGGGPGNPFARQTAALRKALVEAVTPEDITAIAHVLMLKAKQGDLGACKLLFSYVIGKPQDPVDPDTLNRHEWNTWFQLVSDGQDFQTRQQSVPLPVLCAMVPVLFEGQQRTIASLVRAGLEAMDQPAPAAVTEKDGPAAPEAPSTNGLESAPPSPNGQAPSAHAEAPSTNGETAPTQGEAPSTNGPTQPATGVTPSTNGPESAPPSTNGGPQPAEQGHAESRPSKPARRSWLPFLQQKLQEIRAGKHPHQK